MDLPPPQEIVAPQLSHKQVVGSLFDNNAGSSVEVFFQAGYPVKTLGVYVFLVVSSDWRYEAYVVDKHIRYKLCYNEACMFFPNECLDFYEYGFIDEPSFIYF